LKGFEKVSLAPGETKEISIVLDKRAFAFYNTAVNDWHVESGGFDILIGASSADIRLCGSVKVASTAPDAPIPDYSKTAPCYFTGAIADVPDSQFEAVLGRPVPPPEKDKSLPIVLTDNLENSAHTKWGGRFVRLITFIMNRFDKGPNAVMMKAVALQTPFRSFIAMSGGLFNNKMAEGLLRILNSDKTCKGFRMLFGGIPHVLINLKKFLKTM